MTHPQDWIEPLLLGELDDERIRALEQWLLESEANRVAFLNEVQLCRGVRRALIASDNGQALDGSWEDETELTDEDAASDIMSIVVSQALAERRKHELKDEANRLLAEQQAEQAKTDRYRLRRHENASARRELAIPLPLLIAGMAAALFLVVYLLMPGDPGSEGDRTPGMVYSPGGADTSTGPGGTAASVPVAQVHQTHRPTWGGGTSRKPLPDGGMLLGRYVLESGAVELRMGEGAVLLIEGPAEFELTGDHAGRLLAGRVTVDTARSGSGFYLETPAASVSDLGGVFGVRVTDSGQTSAHVYAGRIEIASRGSASSAGPMVLHTAEGAVVDGNNAAPRRAAVAAEQFALDMAAFTGEPYTSGQVDYHNQMPASVVMNRGPQSARAWVALESPGQRLRRGTAWAQGFPERPRVVTDTQDRVIDSYLVVFDPADESGRFKTVEFELTFPGEVLTVITEDSDLAESHGWYGDDTVQYDYRGLRTDGLEGEPGRNNPASFVPDTIELSDDRRTMRVFLGVHDGADVFRVLVARSERVGVGRPASPPFHETTPHFASQFDLTSEGNGLRRIIPPAARSCYSSLKGEK